MDKPVAAPSHESTAESTTPNPTTSESTRPPVPAACARCGHDADFEIADLWLCVDCYHVAGSTCAGVGTLERPTDPVC